MKLTIRELKELIKEQVEEGRKKFRALERSTDAEAKRFAKIDAEAKICDLCGSDEEEDTDDFLRCASCGEPKLGSPDFDDSPLEEAQELAKAYKAAGSPAPKPAQSNIDTSARIRAKMDDIQATKPQQPALEEQVEEAQKDKTKKCTRCGMGAPNHEPTHGGLCRECTLAMRDDPTDENINENIRKMVREAMAQLTEKKKGLPPWLKPGFKDKKNKEEKDETDDDEKDEEDKESLKDKKNKSSKLDEARLMNLIKQTIKQNINSKKSKR